jgi:hypothetical protein
MKIITTLVLGSFALFSCSNENKTSKVSSTLTDSVLLEGIEKAKNDTVRTPVKEEYVDILSYSSFNEIMSVNDMIKSFFILDTVYYQYSEGDGEQISFNRIIGTSQKMDLRSKTMFPSIRDGQLDGIYDLNDSMKLIPFHLDEDMESTIYTKWQPISEDSIKYVGYLNHLFITKYSRVSIINCIPTDDDYILIGENSGGEGGDLWTSIWLMRFDGDQSLHRIVEHETGASEGDILMPGYYTEIKDEEIIIFERMDSIIERNDTLIRVPSSQVEINRIKIN